MRRLLLSLPSMLLLLPLIMAGCSGNECYDNHSALPLAAFYSSVSMRPVSVQQLEIYGVGAPNDSVLYPHSNLQEAYLPFRLWQYSTSYVFAYYGMVSDALGEDEDVKIPADTVTFLYSPKEWFVSPACGAMYFYDMKGVSHTSFLIDSISFNEVITNQNASNIKIFFKEAPAND